MHRTRHLRLRVLLLSIAFVSTIVGAQSNSDRAATQIPPKEDKGAKPSAAFHLVPVDSVLASELATSFVEPLTCDADGNLYLGSDGPASSIRKLTPKGELASVFRPIANPDLKVGATGYFSVVEDGELYVLAFAENEISRYVLVFKPDGSYKSKIKLSPGFPWIPATLAVFPNGNLLVTGQEFVRERDQPMLPFSGIFSADGSLLKEVSLEDDEAITDMVSDQDRRVTSVTNPISNQAVSWGQSASALDGNIYVMRWLSPAIFYVVGPGGQVVRRFQVDPGDADLVPISMHISGDRIAVLFYGRQTDAKVMKIVNLEGREVATYDERREGGKPKLGTLGSAFACYTSKPERFTFLVTADDHRIEMKHVETR